MHLVAHTFVFTSNRAFQRLKLGRDELIEELRKTICRNKSTCAYSSAEEDEVDKVLLGGQTGTRLKH